MVSCISSNLQTYWKIARQNNKHSQHVCVHVCMYVCMHTNTSMYLYILRVFLLLLRRNNARSPHFARITFYSFFLA